MHQCRLRAIDEQKHLVEKAIEDIQLLGNKEQLDALDDMLSSGSNEFTGILKALRSELRNELNLHAVTGDLRFYRMQRS
ncbi:hypothetical protein [Teredinibacter sp. KSP-S5-2]|uniref:hypothetical protein n=1 Tax=Teredinibacter sp. KSP-S5-2 TaxID=3034506 RepID=UPI00293481A1|nr:hypothetical protein [Teredinibacter sp. KSP-S5-2]WNO11660.1 hypothetical protein P5V12_10800 [Teredinibacter sp. KSP-S5-2]